ncbi:MAG TPA: signal recognition particle-docking protein FtsY [Candidatus Caldiarchaeum subterraneum]|uniref:Signal recognition particle-docking protein FtsY n=1 Tax=Caldiarchaeum subterraneum TaxID=311458 RepID=A0A832ZVC8_CALS0|nr:signal recognition particle-docking protein FtsY [Candidatus Caldarchaeum subterraneum]
MFEGLKKAFASLSEKVKTTTLSEKEIEEELDNLFYRLVENDVAVEVAEEVLKVIKDELRKVRIPRFSDAADVVDSIIKKTIDGMVMDADIKEVLKRVGENMRRGKPTVFLFVGPNGSGKTTTVVKIANYLKKHGFSSIIACADTFRAGAIEQLKQLAERHGFWVVSQHYGADPAAVAVDAIRSAEANKIPVVLVDTAGRTEVDKALLQEMNKIKRVTQPDFVIYVGDSLVGNAAAEQALKFNEYVGVDYIVLAKLDADAKGGSALSIAKITGKPLLFIGIGQEISDLSDKPKEKILHALGLN